MKNLMSKPKMADCIDSAPKRIVKYLEVTLLVTVVIQASQVYAEEARKPAPYGDEQRQIAPVPFPGTKGLHPRPKVVNWIGPPTNIEIVDDGRVFRNESGQRTLIGKAGLTHRGRNPREAFWTFDEVSRRAPATLDGLAFEFRQTTTSEAAEKTATRRQSFQVQR